MNPPQQKQIIQIMDDGDRGFLPITSSEIFDYFCNLTEAVKLKTHFSEAWAAFRVIIGGLLIQGYRVFKRLISEQFIILTKSNGIQAQYLYLKVMMKENEKITRKFVSQFRTCLREIDHMRRRKQDHYKICMCFLMSGKWIEIQKSESLEKVMEERDEKTLQIFLKSLKQNEYIVHDLCPKQKKQELQIAQDSQEEFKKLKDILYKYIDTFGKKYQNNYLVDLEKQCNTSYNIKYLINSLNLIIFDVTKVLRRVGELTPMYHQIESASWTSFNRHSKQMDADRKDIMLTGNSRILLLDLIFLKDVKKHVSELYKEEVRKIIQEYKKSYLETCVKVLKITNELNKDEKYIYKYQLKTVDSFSKIVTIID